MKRFLCLFAVLMMGSTLTLAHTDSTSVNLDEKLCDGFAPENDEYIPEWEFTGNGMDEAMFNQILDHAEKVYNPLFKAKGLTFKINRRWSDGTVNAYARRSGTEAHIDMFGGLARHQAITPDGFMMVVCHEIGHHLGGAPKKGARWASNEGQSDYFASAKCMRYMYLAMTDFKIPTWSGQSDFVENKCKAWTKSTKWQKICYRTGMAGFSTAELLRMLRRLPDPVDFEKPDTNVVTTTNDAHPAPQCRLDTYWQGTICKIYHSKDVSDTDANVGYCNRPAKHPYGNRPQCWYKPTASTPKPDPTPTFF